jgi:hypothetical protein
MVRRRKLEPTVIEVTQEDIWYGMQRNRHHCAIVRAIQRKFGSDVQHITVDLEKGVISFSRVSTDTRMVFADNSIIRRFQQKFDVDKSSVEPFHFELSPYNLMTEKPRKHGTVYDRDRTRDKSSDRVHVNTRSRPKGNAAVRNVVISIAQAGEASETKPAS